MDKVSSFNPLDFSGRKILVTGASSGIGRATAIYLSKLGAAIVLNGRNEEQLSLTLSQMEGNGHIVIPFDLTSPDFSPLFERTVADGKKLDGMVHCAGIPYVVPIKMLERKRLDEVMQINFYSFIELVRQYSKKKYHDEGSIVAISSILSLQPRAYETGYIASKGALNSAIGSMACELAKQKMRINGILAGNILTEMTIKSQKQYDNQRHMDEVLESSLLGLGYPNDIASVAAFLLSDMSRFITGRMIYADGGLL